MSYKVQILGENDGVPHTWMRVTDMNGNLVQTSKGIDAEMGLGPKMDSADPWTKQLLDNIVNFNNGKGELHGTEHRTEALNNDPNRYFIIKEIVVSDAQAQSVLNTLDNRWENRFNVTYSFGDNDMCVNWVDGVMQASGIGRYIDVLTDADFSLMNTMQTDNLMPGMLTLGQVAKHSFYELGILGNKAQNVKGGWLLSAAIDGVDGTEDIYDVVVEALNDAYDSVTDAFDSVGNGIYDVFMTLTTAVGDLFGITFSKGSNGVVSAGIVSAGNNNTVNVEPVVIMGEDVDSSGLLGLIKDAFNHKDNTFKYFSKGENGFVQGTGKYLADGQSMTTQDFNTLSHMNGDVVPEFVIAVGGSIDNTTLSSWDASGSGAALRVLSFDGENRYVRADGDVTYNNGIVFEVNGHTVIKLDDNSTIRTEDGTTHNAFDFLDGITDTAENIADFVAAQTEHFQEYYLGAEAATHFYEALGDFLQNGANIRLLIDGDYEKALENLGKSIASGYLRQEAQAFFDTLLGSAFGTGGAQNSTAYMMHAAFNPHSLQGIQFDRGIVQVTYGTGQNKPTAVNDNFLWRKAA